MHYLLIKTHNKTKLKYLCKTSCQDPQKYNGSGKYWKRHLKEHGIDVSTEILYQTEDLTDFNLKCISYSNKLNVVKSNEWANLINETGLDGGTTHKNPYWLVGFKHSEETKEKIRQSSKRSIEIRRERGDNLATFKGKKHTRESCKKMSDIRIGMKFSDTHRENISKSRTGMTIDLSETTRNKLSSNMSKMLSVLYKCNICGKTGNFGQLKKYHSVCQDDKKYNPTITSEKSTDIIEKICIICKSEYETKRNSRSSTCSRSCAAKSQWKRQNEKH